MSARSRRRGGVHPFMVGPPGAGSAEDELTEQRMLDWLDEQID
jgi:hypothetical protein